MKANHNYCSKRGYVFLLFLLAAVSMSFITGCAVPAPMEEAKQPELALAADAVNINVASAAEIERIPSIGGVLATRIVEFREKYGRFRRPEHLLMVQGIGDKRFRRIRRYIKTE